METKFALHWFGSMFQKRPYFDGVLACILCMATNLEHLNLTMSSCDVLPLTLEVLGGPCDEDEGAAEQEDDHDDVEGGDNVEDEDNADDLDIADGGDEGEDGAGVGDKDEVVDGENADTPYPFWKLKTFSIQGSDYYGSPLQAPVLPTLEKLQLKQCAYDRVNTLPLYFPYAPHASGAKLHTLEIDQVNLDLPWFAITLSEPDFSALKQLIVSGVGWNWEHGPWNEYDFRHLSDAITAHLPDLERLEWTYNELDREWGLLKPFGSFKALSKLKHLAVDYELITSQSHGHDHYPDHLVNPHAFLPDSLKMLHLTDVHHALLDRLCDRYAKFSTGRSSALPFVSGLFSTFALEHFNMHINMEFWGDDEDGTSELEKSTRKFLRVMVEELDRMGTEMRVWRQGGRLPERLLMAPGFAVPWPYWGDVDQGHWCKKDREWWEIKNGLRAGRRNEYTHHDEDYADSSGDEDDAGDDGGQTRAGRLDYVDASEI